MPSSVESKVEQYLKRICRAPARRSQASAARLVVDRLCGRDRPAFQRDDDRFGIGRRRAFRRDADQLHGAHAAPHERVAQIGGAGEIVGDRPQQHAHRSLPAPGPQISFDRRQERVAIRRSAGKSRQRAVAASGAQACGTGFNPPILPRQFGLPGP